MQDMALIPLADLGELAALLGIRTWHPADAADLGVLRELLARRTALAQRSGDPDRVTPPTPHDGASLRLTGSAPASLMSLAFALDGARQIGQHGRICHHRSERGQSGRIPALAVPCRRCTV